MVGSEVAGRSRRFLLCHVADGTGVRPYASFISARQQQWLCQTGARLRCFGEGPARSNGFGDDPSRMSADRDGRAAGDRSVDAGLSHHRRSAAVHPAQSSRTRPWLSWTSFPCCRNGYRRPCGRRFSCRLFPRRCGCCISRRPTLPWLSWKAVVIPPGGGWLSRSCWLINSVCVGCVSGCGDRPHRR